MAVNVSYGERYGWMVVQVAGEVDISGAAALRERLQRLIADGCRQIVVDISRLAFCDSTGVGVLVATRRLLAARGGRLRLVLPGPEVHTRKVLSAFGIERIFEVYDSAEGALADQREAAAAAQADTETGAEVEAEVGTNVGTAAAAQTATEVGTETGRETGTETYPQARTEAALPAQRDAASATAE